MASSTKSTSTDKLESLLQCSICLETLDDPRTLPCFHSFCKSCLERFVKSHRGKKAFQDLYCPVCRTEFTLNGKGVSGITPNHFICNMLEVLNIQKVKGVPCKHCEEPSIGRCVTCELFMCEDCLKSHNTYPGFRNHSVLMMDELSQPENQGKIKERSHCQEHSNKKLKFYCETCEELICRYCMDFDHIRPEHVCLPLEKVAKKKIEALKVDCATLDDKLSKVNETLQVLKNVAQSLEDNMKKTRKVINQRKIKIFRAVERTLDRNAESLMEEADVIFNYKRQVIAQDMKQVQTYVDKLKGCSDLSNSLLANGNDEEIVLSQKIIQENVEKLKNEYPGNSRSAHDDKILTHDSKQIDAMLMEDVVKTFGNDKGRLEMVADGEKLPQEYLTFDVNTGKLKVITRTVNHHDVSIQWRMAKAGFGPCSDEHDR